MGRLMAFALCVSSIAACAHVRPTQSWEELAHRLTPGVPVAVTDTKGTEVRGTVSAVSPASVTLAVDKASRTFDAKDVRRVRRDGDSLWNGLIIGAAIGALGVALPDNRCTGQPVRCDDKQIPARVALFGIATAAGVGIDALRRNQSVLFIAPGRTTMRVVPLLTRDRKSLTITIRR